MGGSSPTPAPRRPGANVFDGARWPSPRWRKVIRDAAAAKGRVLSLVLAVAAALFALGTTLGGFAVASRELARAYRATNPASATIELDAVDPALVSRVRALPEVADADGRATVRGRIRDGRGWRSLLLFVIPDFTQLRIARVTSLEGAWPPPPGTLLIDQMSARFVHARTGTSLTVQLPDGPPTEVSVSGLVWDSSLAPAAMEQTVWGYTTPETYARLGHPGPLDELKIVVRDRPLDEAAVKAAATRVGAWLGAQGHPVREIQIPPPGRHPHQGQMTAVMAMLIGFAGFSLLLSGILVESNVAAWMARQIRELGVMRAIGGRTSQIVAIYVVMMSAVGLGALVLALPTSVVAARALVSMVAANLNIQLGDRSVPLWVGVVVTLLGLGVPVAAAVRPVWRATRIDVRRALDHVGAASVEGFGRGFEARFFRAIAGGRGSNGLGRLAVRNAFRQRGRLLLIVGLLAAAGSTFLTAFNLPRAFGARLAEMSAGRKFALAVRLQSATPAAPALRIAGAVPGVTALDGVRVANATWGEAGDIAVVQTYPDQGHGRFQMVGVPSNTTLIDFPVAAGRWLSGADDGGVVLNHMARAAVPEAAVGDLVTFSAEGHTHRRRVVGFVRDLGSPATAYVPANAFQGAGWSPEPNAINLLYVGVATAEAPGGPKPSVASIAAAIEAGLTSGGVRVAQVVATEALHDAVTEHMVVLIGLLLALAALMTVVATLGLAAAMGTAVVERTRELGVMAALGATPAAIVRIVAGEGLVVGALGGVAGVLLAVPVSAGVGALVGSLAFRVSLPIVLSPIGVLAWLTLVAVLAAVASGAPARRAGRIGVPEALART